MSEAGPPRIWVVDGGSDDKTVDLVCGLGFDHVSVVPSPLRIQAASVNLGAGLALEHGGFDVLIRVDAHARYPAGFCRRLLETMAETAADSVVVPLIAAGGSKLQDAQAILQNAWLGTGGSLHRGSKMRRGFVDHGHHAAIRLDVFLDVGGYDPDFRACEDVELDLRLIKSGKRIFLESSLVVDYSPRSTLFSFAAQQKRNGDSRIQLAMKHGMRTVFPMMQRQLLLLPLLPSLLAGIVLGAVVSKFFWLLPMGYILVVLFLSFLATQRMGRVRLTCLVMILAMTMHISYSYGMWVKLLISVFYPKSLFRLFES